MTSEIAEDRIAMDVCPVVVDSSNCVEALELTRDK
jgi:hypothetical protein